MHARSADAAAVHIAPLQRQRHSMLRSYTPPSSSNPRHNPDDSRFSASRRCRSTPRRAMQLVTCAPRWNPQNVGSFTGVQTWSRIDGLQATELFGTTSAGRQPAGKQLPAMLRWRGPAGTCIRVRCSHCALPLLQKTPSPERSAEDTAALQIEALMTNDEPWWVRSKASFRALLGASANDLTLQAGIFNVHRCCGSLCNVCAQGQSWHTDIVRVWRR